MKKIIFLSLIILLIGAGGFFWWRQGREIKGSPKDYIIKETPEGKIVENKRAGLTIKVPEGWETKKIELLEGSVIFDTPDIKGIWQNEMISPPLETGCGIESTVVYEEMDFDILKEKIKEIHAGLGIKSEEFEVIMINNQQSLKNSFDSISIGPGIAVYFIQKNKLYNFTIYWAPEDKERCIQEFDKFLESVSIK
jgi:hypothetical protein